MWSMKNGTVVTRMPVALHAALKAEADRQGVSMNQLVVALLASGIGFKVKR